jgi:putative endonuclease
MTTKSKMTTKEMGAIGEDLAVRHLIQKGYKILASNWQFLHFELDIVASQDNLLIIVEVKTRQSEFWESPKEAVTRKKQRHIIAAANAYIEKFNIDLETRFDIVEVILNESETRIEHIEDAFYPIVK